MADRRQIAGTARVILAQGGYSKYFADQRSHAVPDREARANAALLLTAHGFTSRDALACVDLLLADYPRGA